jgi:hypothetical protein
MDSREPFMEVYPIHQLITLVHKPWVGSKRVVVLTGHVDTALALWMKLSLRYKLYERLMILITLFAGCPPVIKSKVYTIPKFFYIHFVKVLCLLLCSVLVCASIRILISYM